MAVLAAPATSGKNHCLPTGTFAFSQTVRTGTRSVRAPSNATGTATAEFVSDALEFTVTVGPV